MPFEISSDYALVQRATSIDKVRTILNNVSGRGSYGELKELLQEELKGTINNKTLDHAICTLIKKNQQIKESKFHENYLVNKADDDYDSKYYDSLKVNDSVLRQALMDKYKGKETSIEYSSLVHLFNEIVQFMKENGGKNLKYPEMKNGPSNLFNKLDKDNLIDIVSDNPFKFKVQIDDSLSSDSQSTDLKIPEATQPKGLIYLIEEQTVEKYEVDGEVKSFTYSFLNIGITSNTLQDRYGNHGYHLHMLFEGDYDTVIKMEDEIKNKFNNHRRYNRRDKITKEQYDNKEQFCKIKTYFFERAKYHNLDDILDSNNAQITKNRNPPQGSQEYIG